MKVLFNKFKKAKLSTRLVYITTLLLFLISYVVLLVNVLRLHGVETNLRIIGLVSLGVLFLLYGFIDLLLVLSKKNKTVYFTSLFIVILSAICIVGSMTINRLLSSFDSLSKETVIYTTNLIALNGTEYKNDESFVTGIINNDTDIEGNVLAYELINQDKLKIKLQKYDSYFEMLEDLYAGKIQGMFVSSNYAITYSSYDEYKGIKDDTKVILTYSKEMKNQDYIENFTPVTEPFTLLIMGVDSTASSLKKAASFNGDTLILMSFNPKTLDATIFSIPRDTYVPIACLNGEQSKINSSGAYGTKCVINTVQNLTGINIDYYVKVDFQGVVDLVNAVGGIDVDVQQPDVKKYISQYGEGRLCESNQNRDMVNVVCMNTGLQHLNGEQALAYARNRHGFLTGDFARNDHQQQIIEGVAKSIKNVKSVNDFYSILDVVSPNIDTNMQTKQILSLYGVAKNAFIDGGNATINIQKTKLTGTDQTIYINNLRHSVWTYIYSPQSLQEIVDTMNVTLGKKKPTMITTFSFSVNSEYKVPIIGNRYYAVQKDETLPSFVGESLDFVKTWAKERNITLNYNFIREGNERYDKELTEGQIIGQGTPKNTPVKNISSLTLDVITHYDPDANKTTTTTTKTTTTTTTADPNNPTPDPGNNNDPDDDYNLDNE